MDMADNEAMPECLHGIAEDIAADGLDDILHELRTVGFDAFPLLCGTNCTFRLNGAPVSHLRREAHASPA